LRSVNFRKIFLKATLPVKHIHGHLSCSRTQVLNHCHRGFRRKLQVNF